MTQNACSFVKSTSCCANAINSRKANILKVTCAKGHIDNLNQTMDTENIQGCELTNLQASESDQTSTTTNSSTNNSENKGKDGDNTGLIIGVVVVVVVAVVVVSIGAYFVFKQKLKILFLIA